MGRVEVRVAWADKEADKSGYWLDIFEHETARFDGDYREALIWARNKIDKELQKKQRKEKGE